MLDPPDPLFVARIPCQRGPMYNQAAYRGPHDGGEEGHEGCEPGPRHNPIFTPPRRWMPPTHQPREHTCSPKSGSWEYAPYG